MSSMIVSTKPDRRIVEASPELAEAVGSDRGRMCGLDCAKVLRCRNAEGKSLCGQFCPALAAARGSSGLAQEVPIWLKNPDRGLREFAATFQRIGKLANDIVVVYFGEAEQEPEAADLPAAGDWVPQRQRSSAPLRQVRRQSRPDQRRRSTRLHLIIS